VGVFGIGSYVPRTSRGLLPRAVLYDGIVLEFVVSIF
jgi:hypothetical protein